MTEYGNDIKIDLSVFNGVALNNVLNKRYCVLLVKEEGVVDLTDEFIYGEQDD